MKTNFSPKEEQSKGSLCNINIWDKVGPQRFEMLRPELRLADGVIFSFDANNEISYTNLKKWLVKAQDSTPDYVGRIIVANHMKSDDAVITREECRKLAKDYSAKYYEMS